MENLLNGLINESTKAYKELEKRTFPNHLKKLNGDIDVAWDLYQDAVLSFIIHIRRNSETFPSALAAIAYMNKALEWRRLDYWKRADIKNNTSLNASMQIDNLLPYAPNNPQKELENKEFRGRLEGIMGKMADECSTLIQMKLEDNCKWEEIYPLFDAQTNSQQTMLRTKLGRCVRILREKLADFLN